jgi:hypothetical protein
MKLDEFRSKMETHRRAADDEARQLKDSYYALAKLESLYRTLDREERALADQVISEWVLSGDEGRRFDALSLIEDFHIKSARPALAVLTARLASSVQPGAIFECHKVDRIIKEFDK